jgi:hypothetical protein
VKDFWSEFPQAPQEREGLIVDVGSTVKKPNSRKTGMDGLEKPLWPKPTRPVYPPLAGKAEPRLHPHPKTSRGKTGINTNGREKWKNVKILLALLKVSSRRVFNSDERFSCGRGRFSVEAEG